MSDVLWEKSFLQPVNQELGYFSHIALGYRVDDRGFESWQELGISLHHHVQTGSYSVDCRGVELYLHTPIRLHGVMLS
jgi:hypothetical protein